MKENIKQNLEKYLNHQKECKEIFKQFVENPKLISLISELGGTVSPADCKPYVDDFMKTDSGKILVEALQKMVDQWIDVLLETHLYVKNKLKMDLESKAPYLILSTAFSAQNRNFFGLIQDKFTEIFDARGSSVLDDLYKELEDSYKDKKAGEKIILH